MDATSAEIEVIGETPVARARRRAALCAIDAQGLCERCASIPWEKLATTSDLDDDLSFPIGEVLLDLEMSRCRVCRFFGSTVLSHAFAYSPEPFMIRQYDTDIFHSNQCKGLFFENPISRSSEMASGRPRYPHLIITSLDVEQAQSQLQHVYPSRIDMNIISLWLDECNACHGMPCTPSSTNELEGLKVINCARRSIELAPPNCQYVALSYVWGQQEASSAVNYSHEFEQALPKTIEDSITVTLSLGYTYLWVDRYCIDQNDNAHKNAQIGHMGDIYSSAQITIVAAAGSDSNYGLPGVRPESRGVAFSGEHIGLLHLLMYPGESAARDILYTEWIRRACVRMQQARKSRKSTNADSYRTLQEFYLSPRRLIFTERQVMYVCSSKTACETHPHQREVHEEFQTISNREYHQHWIRLLPDPVTDSSTDPKHRLISKAHILMKTLEAYSMRKMSFDGDALHAITGILKQFAKHGAHSIWGTPCFASVGRYATHLCNGHSWLDPKRTERFVELALLMDNYYPCERRLGFPSWSPLGWTSPFQWTGGEGPDRRRTYPQYITADASSINIESAGKSYNLSSLMQRTQPEIEDVMMNASPYLEITARTTTLRLVDPEHEKYDTAVAFPLHDGIHKILYPRWTNVPKGVEQGSTIKGLLLLCAGFTNTIVKHVYAMVLILSDHGGHYEKIGDFELPQRVPTPYSYSWRRWDEERRIWHHDESDIAAIEMLAEESDNALLREEHEPECWWWRYFKDEETIILG